MSEIDEKKRGKWIAIDEMKLQNEYYDYIGDQIEMKCSVCGCEVWLWETLKDYNFCPYCGADMRKVKDEHTN